MEVDEPYQQYRKRMVKSGNPKNTGKTKPSNLTMQVKMNKNYPTPNTPSGGAKADGSAPQGMNGGKGHREMMKDQFNPGAKLNPSWVESLMGVPTNHTQLSTATDPGENRIDRLRLLGNGVVPQTAAKAFSTLLSRLEQD
jgi:site-specific DNA-cytosine methylase